MSDANHALLIRRLLRALRTDPEYSGWRKGLATGAILASAPHVGQNDPPLYRIDAHGPAIPATWHSAVPTHRLIVSPPEVSEVNVPHSDIRAEAAAVLEQQPTPHQTGNATFAAAVAEARDRCRSFFASSSMYGSLAPIFEDVLRSVPVRLSEMEEGALGWYEVSTSPSIGIGAASANPVPTIVHELLHAVHYRVMRELGLTVSGPDEAREPFMFTGVIGAHREDRYRPVPQHQFGLGRVCSLIVDAMEARSDPALNSAMEVALESGIVSPLHRWITEHESVLLDAWTPRQVELMKVLRRLSISYVTALNAASDTTSLYALQNPMEWWAEFLTAQILPEETKYASRMVAPRHKWSEFWSDLAVAVRDLTYKIATENAEKKEFTIGAERILIPDVVTRLMRMPHALVEAYVGVKVEQKWPMNFALRDDEGRSVRAAEDARHHERLALGVYFVLALLLVLDKKRLNEKRSVGQEKDDEDAE